MACLSFRLTKSQRLLTAGDYRNVFAHAEFRVSHPHCLILAQTRGIGHHCGRLGLIIAKRHVRLAVQRNRIKRVIRESFRQRQSSVAIDVIVLARKGLDQLDNQHLHTLLTQLWQKLQRKIAANRRPV